MNYLPGSAVKIIPEIQYIVGRKSRENLFFRNKINL
jgi:hypothetical protein